MLFTNNPYILTSCYVFVIIETGAYAIGWGVERNDTHFGGIWIQEEAELSVNKLELLKSWKNLSKMVFPNHLFYYVSIRPCTPIF